MVALLSHLFGDYFFQRSFFTKNYFLIAAINLNTRVHCLLVLFTYVIELSFLVSMSANLSFNSCYRHMKVGSQS